MNRESVGKALERDLGVKEFAYKPVLVETTESILMNPMRQKIFQFLCKKPCSYLRDVAREFNIALPTAKWHLKKMHAFGFLNSKQIENKVVYYPPGLLSDNDVEVVALLNNRTAYRIYTIIANSNGITQKELAVLIDIYQQKVAWWLARLKKHNLIVASKDGKTLKYFPSPRLLEVYENCRANWQVFKESLFKKLQSDGVQPGVLKSDDKTFKVELKIGKEKFKLAVDLFEVEA